MHIVHYYIQVMKVEFETKIKAPKTNIECSLN